MSEERYVTFEEEFPDISVPDCLRGHYAGRWRNGRFISCHPQTWFYVKMQREFVRESGSPPHVYFIQSIDGGPVKIGVSRNPHCRLREIQANHPHNLQIVAMCQNGGRTLESAIHRALGDERLNGEWFEMSDELEFYLKKFAHKEQE